MNSKVPGKIAAAAYKQYASYASAVRKSVRNEFYNNLETQTSKIFPSVPTMGTPHEDI